MIVEIFASRTQCMRVDFQTLVVDFIGCFTNDAVDGIGMLRVMNEVVKALFNNVIQDGVHCTAEFKAIGWHRYGCLVGSVEDTKDFSEFQIGTGSNGLMPSLMDVR